MDHKSENVIVTRSFNQFNEFETSQRLIRYADDTAVLVDSLIGFQELMNRMNRRKTKFMRISKQDIQNWQQFISLVETLSKFTYLGPIIIIND